jgi:SAM-dependent methyltransferase
MIKVLRSSREIETAGRYLQERDVTSHYDALKNWDLSLLHAIAAPLPRTIRIVDLGCAGLAALKFFYFLGFKDIEGMDLTVTRKEKWQQIAIMCKSLSLKPPFRFYAGDLTNTRYADGSVDLATCISVIEHGVDPVQFFREMNRIIKPGGILFVTTDYWPEKMNPGKDEKPCGLSYTIFSKEEIIQLIALAGRYGFSLYEETDLSTIPDPTETHILGEIYDHTFICTAFRKSSAAAHQQVQPPGREC